MRREVLSTALACRAGELPCLELRSGCPARPTERTEAGILVEAGGRQILTRLLVGADGLNSGVRDWAGLSGPRPDIWRWGTRQHFRVQPWSEYVEVYWQKGIEAYITACAPDLVGVGMLWEPEIIGKVGGGDRLMASLLESFPALQRTLRNADPLDEPLSIGPLQRKVIAPVGDRVLLVGDAAGYLDALTGEGLSLALSQALAAAQTVARLLERAGGATARFSATELQPYARAHRKSVRAYTLFTRLALHFSHHSGLMEAVIPLLQRRPVAFQALLSASMGRIF
jgi:2-polyprenyl-6-methoxyphenol hydroxylase-like FAD-dependent oxidoreductase